MIGVKAWIQAFRLRTLPLAFSCILMGAFLAEMADAFRWSVFVWSLVTTLFLQVLSNLANDYGDAGSGVDGEQRTGPSRTVSAGLITQSAMKRALIIFSLLSLCSGLYLLFLALGSNWPQILIFLLIGLGAIAAAIKYTVGRNPYGYAGFGDIFVLIFFGIVGVGGSYFLHAQTLQWPVLLPALSCGLLAVGVLNVNNIRDIESDRASGKFSIPVRIGRQNAVIYHWVLLTLAVVFSVWYVSLWSPALSSYLFLLITPLLYINARAVKVKSSAEGLDPYLKQLALTTLFFVLLFGMGQII